MDNFENQNVYENNQVGGNVPPVDYQPKFNPETGEPLYNQQMNQPKFDSETGEPLYQQNVQPQYNQTQYEQPQYSQNQYGANQYNQPNDYRQNQYNQSNGYAPNQYTPSQYTPPVENIQQDGKGLGSASLVLGIVSFPLNCFCGIGIISAILGLIFGIVSRSKNKVENGMAIAGIVISAVALLFWIFVIIYAVVADSSANYLNYYDF